MNLKLTKERISTAFLNSAFWIPILFFCTQLFVSIRSENSLFEVSKYAIVVFILLAVLCWSVKKVVIYLDKHQPVANNYAKRLVKQSLYGLIIPLGAVLLLLVAYDKSIDERIIQKAFLLKELSLCAFFLYMFNCASVSIELEKRVSILPKEPDNDKQFNEKFLVYRKGFYAPINLIEVAMVYQSGHLNWIVTFDDERYVLNISLKEANTILDSQNFFAINRTHIIHRAVVETVRSGSFGKIELKLTLQAIITTVSKGRASGFRKWFYCKSEHLGVRVSK